jgi:hypothetical protein
VFVTAISRPLVAFVVCCPQRRTSFVALPILVELSFAAPVAIDRKLPQVDLLLHPCCIGLKVSGKLVYRDSHSCYSQFSQIGQRQSSASSFATEWSFKAAG